MNNDTIETRAATPGSGERLNLLSGAAFAALGMFMAVKSWNMPRLEHRDVSPYTVPGIVPGALGVVILLLGLTMLIRALVKGGWRWEGAGSTLRTSLLTEGAAKFLLALVLTVGYAAGMVGRYSFELSTFLFLCVFILLFEWNKPRAGEDALRVFRRIDEFFVSRLGAVVGIRVKTAIMAALLAAIVAFTVSFVFQEVFLIRLP